MEIEKPGPGVERRILIADDDPDSRIVVASVISVLGHSPVVVNGGGEALEECERELPDLAIVDYIKSIVLFYFKCKIVLVIFSHVKIVV